LAIPQLKTNDMLVKQTPTITKTRTAFRNIACCMLPLVHTRVLVRRVCDTVFKNTV